MGRRAQQAQQEAARQRAVAAALDTLPASYFVLHGLDVPNSTASVDHLVIGPGGAWAIKTEAFGGPLVEAPGTLLWRGKPINDESAVAADDAETIGGWLGYPVAAVMCVVDSELPKAVHYLPTVTVCSPDSIVRYLSSKGNTLFEAQTRGLYERALPLVRATGAASPTRTAKPRSAPKQRSVARRILPASIALCALVALIVALPKVSHWFSKSDAQTTTPTSTVSPTTTVPLGSLPATTASSAGVDAPPTIAFVCPSPLQHWTITLAPTKYVADPVGYNVWFQAPDGSWPYWGLFKSGISTPAGLTGIEPGRIVIARYDRHYLPDGSKAVGVLQFTAAPGC